MEENMKKAALIVLAVVLSVAASQVNAGQADYKQFYVGAGGGYAVEDFQNADLDNSWGVYAKVGYHFHKLLAIQFDYNYLFEFEEEDSLELGGSRFDGKVEVEIMTFMLSLKGYFPVDYFIKPYVIAGLGAMYANADIKVSGAGASADDSEDKTDYCGKIGAGLDFFLSDNISLNFESNYTSGFDDLEDLRYFNFLLGATFHF